MSGAAAKHKRKSRCDIDLTVSPPGSPSVAQSEQDVDRLPFYLFINDSSEPSELAQYIVDITEEDNTESYVYKRLMQLHREKKSHFPYVTDEEFEGLVGDVASTKPPKAVGKKAPPRIKYERRKAGKKMKIAPRPAKPAGKRICISDGKQDDDDEQDDDGEQDDDDEQYDDGEQDEYGKQYDDGEQDDDAEDEMTEQDQIEAFGDFMHRKMVEWNKWPRPGVPISALQHIKWMVNFSAS